MNYRFNSHIKSSPFSDFLDFWYRSRHPVFVSFYCAASLPVLNHWIPWWKKPWHSLACWLDTIRGDHKRPSANISLTSPSFQRLSQCSLKKHVFSWVFCPDRGSSIRGTPHCPRQRKQPDARNWLGTRFCVAVWEVTLFETMWYMGKY